MDALLAEPLPPGSLRLGVIPSPDNPRGVVVVPTSLPEAADYDVAWIQGMPDIGTVSAQHVGRANRLIHAASSMAEVRTSINEAIDATAGDGVLVLISSRVTVRPGGRPDTAGNGYVISAKSPWDDLNAAVAGACGSDALAHTDAEADAHWQVLPAYVNRPFVGAAQTPSGTFQPTVARQWGVLRASMNEFVNSFMFTVRDEQFIQDYLEGLRRRIDVVVDLLRLVLVVVLAALSHRPQAPIFLLVMLATIRHYGHRGEPDGHFLPARAVHLCTSRGVACLMT